MWFIWDVYGIALFFVIWTALLGADYITARYVLYPWFPSAKDDLIPIQGLGRVIFWVYNAIVCMVGITHFRAMLTDPGTLRDVSVPPNIERPKCCKICDGRWKPPRAHHCKTCNSCIFRMDHHCPWINNCVGIRNQKYFILFLIYVAFLAAFSFVLVGLAGTFWLRQSYRTFNKWSLFWCIILFLESVFFIRFASDFLMEQIESIETNTSLIEVRQRAAGPTGTFGENMRQVFGRLSWRWILPVSPRLVPDYAEPVTQLPSPEDPVELCEEIGIAGDDDESDLSPAGLITTPDSAQKGTPRRKVPRTAAKCVDEAQDETLRKHEEADEDGRNPDRGAQEMRQRRQVARWQLE